MRDITVWACHADFGEMCPNPILDASTGLRYPDGNLQGQAGWNVAVKFASLSQLAQKLRTGVAMPRQFCGRWFQDCDPIQFGEISKLAILVHGDQQGVLYVNGKSAPKITLSSSNISAYHSDLHTIGLYTRAGSSIMFASCLAGQGPEGTRLLTALSRVWPGRRVVGFSTLGYRHSGVMKLTGQACEAPGMRDTEARDAVFANQNQLDSDWGDLKKMPWASESSHHAKVVRDGAVERYPDEEEADRRELKRRGLLQKWDESQKR